ncbi:MAG: hypothetical protein R3F56_08350 [Planctomycetota bacterium]
MKRSTLRARRALLRSGLPLLAAACGGSPGHTTRVPLAANQPAEVVFVDSSKRLTLRSLTSVDEAAYRERGLYGQVSPDVKLADHGTMQAMVDALDELGHFTRGTAQMRAGAKSALVVKLGDRQTVWSQPALQPENMAELEQFNTALAAFMQVYNNMISYHASNMSAQDFDRALAEQEAKNRNAVDNIMQKARKGQ